MSEEAYQAKLEHLAIEGLVYGWLSLPAAAEMSKLSYYELGARVMAYYQAQEAVAA